MADWVSIAEISSGGKSSQIYYSPSSKDFSYSSGYLPLTLAQIVTLDGQGVVAWDREDVHQAVIAAASTGVAGNAEDRRRGQSDAGGNLLRKPRFAWAAAGLLLLATTGLVAWGAFVPEGPAAEVPGPSPSERVRTYLSGVDGLVEGHDRDGYAGAVDLAVVGGIMESATIEAYASLPAGTAAPGGEEAIREAYSGYAAGVLDRVAAGDAAGVPLYGISDGTYSSSGGEVTVAVLPGPSGGEASTTVPVPSGGSVRYVFSVGEDGVRLLRIEGMAPYLTPTAVLLSGYGQE